MKTLIAALLITISVISTPAFALGPNLERTDRAQLVNQQQKDAWAQETFYKGKRCKFNKAETIITAVGWIFGVIPGAIITPLACKMDWFE